MGARLLRPKPGGTVLDGPAVAELLGHSTTEVYAMARAGHLPPPLNVGWAGRSVRRWRWSRKAIQAYTPLPLTDDRGAA